MGEKTWGRKRICRSTIFVLLVMGILLGGVFCRMITTAKEAEKRILFISSYSYSWPSVPYQIAGIKSALKDNINLKSYPTTASSKILANFVSPYDATVTKKLKENLIPIIGKANMDEFAMGSSNENSATKIVHNPWNLNKVPGGSSGGSAAAVTAS